MSDPKTTRLVYSTDPRLNEKCLKCKELKFECTCPKEAEVNLTQFVAKLRMERAGRGGKTVTVIDALPKNAGFLKELCTSLKKACGTGGTVIQSGSDGIIEIQGDHREKIRELLTKKGIRNKG